MAKLSKPIEKNIVSSINKVSNLQKKDNNEVRKKPLQFIVSEEFHKEFKGFANEQGMKMNELFDAMYNLYKSNH